MNIFIGKNSYSKEKLAPKTTYRPQNIVFLYFLNWKPYKEVIEPLILFTSSKCNIFTASKKNFSQYFQKIAELWPFKSTW